MPGVELLVNQFIKEVRKRKNEATDATACLTVELLRSVISQQKLPHANQAAALVEAVKAVGEQLTASNPCVLVVGNIVKRVLHIIREEDQFLLTGAVGGLKLSDGSDDVDTVVLDDNNKLVPSPAALEATSSLRPPTLRALLEGKPNSATTSQTHVLESGSERKGDQKSSWKLKGNVIESLNNLIEDINICHEQIAAQAVELIHQNEIILTLGHSKTVLEFLCAAKEKKRSFKVFVAEGAPSYQGHVLAKELVARKLSTTVITDSAVFAIISRVNMVVVGAHAVMANGGVMGPVGLNMVALAAQKHSVPLVVVAGTHKLCPLYPHNPEVLLNEMMSPAELLSFGEFSDSMDFQIGNGAPLLHVVNPGCDYVPPKFVSLFITDEGGHNPSFMHRLVSDYYCADDIVGQQNPTS